MSLRRDEPPRVRRHGSPLTVAVLRNRPKVELHLHLEGSVSQALARRLATRGGRERGPIPSAPVRITDFDSFLRCFASACAGLRSPSDLRAVVVALGAQLRRERVLHAEVFFSPDVHARAGLGYEVVVAALEEGAARVEARGGPSLLFIADGVRQWGGAAFRGMIAAVISRPSIRVRAVGLGGREDAFPARDFQASVAVAQRAGLAVVIHAGEFGTPESVREAVKCLAPTRLAHGIRCAADPSLVEHLAELALPLDVCLTSNRRTGAVPKGVLHPLRALVRRGVRVTLGTDDPALFHVTLSGEYARAAREGLGWRELRRIAATAAGSSLLSEPERSRLVERIRNGWST